MIGTLRPTLDYVEHEDGSMHSAEITLGLPGTGISCRFCRPNFEYKPMPACPVAVARLRATMKELENGDGSL